MSAPRLAWYRPDGWNGMRADCGALVLAAWDHEDPDNPEEGWEWGVYDTWPTLVGIIAGEDAASQTDAMIEAEQAVEGLAHGILDAFKTAAGGTS